MIDINLLPKEFRRKSFSFTVGKTGVYTIGAVVGIIVMLVSVTFYQVHQLSSLEDKITIANRRASMLQKDIRVVDALIDVKQKITQRMAAVERLDSHRSAWVRILTDLASNIPEFVWLGKIEEIKEKTDPSKSTQANQANQQQKSPQFKSSVPTVRLLRVEGYAFTLNALASFMIKTMRSNYFDEVELVSSDEVKFDEYKAHNFVLTTNLHYLSDEEMLKLIAKNEVNSKLSSQKTSHKKLN